MNCPGSIRATRAAPPRESKYADEGTEAHEMARACLISGEDPRDEHVKLYVDVCRRLMRGAQYFIEVQVSLEKLHPPVSMFGTADFVAYDPERRELTIADFKYGRGVWVPARNNQQLRYYALGAALMVDGPVSNIVTIVVQPRFANGDPIRAATFDAIELAEWSIHLMARARAALEPNALTVAGPHCKFCAAQPTCLAYQQSRQVAAFHEFTLADAQSSGT
jgi:hypothetical protein